MQIKERLGLISDCIREIKHLQRSCENYTFPGGEDLFSMYKSQLLRQQLALAALEDEQHKYEQAVKDADCEGE